MKKLLFPELSYKITGLCFKIHKELGRFGREKQYADKLEELLKENNVSYKREYEIHNLDPKSPLGNKVDFLIDSKIIVDLKNKKFITKEDYNQMQRYLQTSSLELGLIVNFRSTHLKPKRVLNIKMYSDNSDTNSEHSDRCFKILEHPADVKVQAFGETKEELFKNALKGMSEVLRAKIKDKKEKIKNKIKVKSVDINALLVDFLSEVLYLSQVNKRVYNDIKFIKFSDKGLEGELSGHNVESFGEDIKAATYHGLKIEKNKQNLWQVTILLDI